MKSISYLALFACFAHNIQSSEGAGLRKGTKPTSGHNIFFTLQELLNETFDDNCITKETIVSSSETQGTTVHCTDGVVTAEFTFSGTGATATPVGLTLVGDRDLCDRLAPIRYGTPCRLLMTHDVLNFEPGVTDEGILSETKMELLMFQWKGKN